MSYILSIDQGTSSTKAIVFDKEGKAVARGVEPLKTYYSNDGFAEQVPDDIYQNVLEAVALCLEDFVAKGHAKEEIVTIGISNQRETFVFWDKDGNPLHNAVVWQCKRSVAVCQTLVEQGFEPAVRYKTGLVIDPYFSGTKVLWLQQNVPAIAEAIAAGNAYFGTVDTWLLYRMTKGTSYLTDHTNASRTLFFNLQELSWDQELLEMFGLQKLHLPELRSSSAYFGETDLEGLFANAIPVSAMIGDSHAATFGEGCFSPGYAKATLGTGCSVMMNIGAQPTPSAHGMVTTICWSVEGRVDYALEGVIVTCGATIEWLKNELGIITDSKETEAMARAVDSSNGVYLVPAFSGLGAPHWNMQSKAAIVGLSFGSNKNHIVRAALESIPFQIKDVFTAMRQDAGIPLLQLMADGGITSNEFVLQSIADLLGNEVVRIRMSDVSALGAAYMAGLKAGIFNSIDHLKQLNDAREIIQPSEEKTDIVQAYAGWQKAVADLLAAYK